MRYIVILLVCSAALLFPQGRDTSKVIRELKPKNDLVKAPSDSLMANDTSKAKKIIPRDTLKPVNQAPLFDGSYFISKNTFLKNEYKSAQDLFENSPLFLVKDLGSVGQPNEAIINGAGQYSTQYYSDGAALNGGGSWFNLTYIQTENIDSIEIIHAVRSFWYGTDNSLAGVNFITKNSISRIPQTRIKYYQGTKGAAMLDAQYSSVVFNKFALSFDMTSRKADDFQSNTTYKNYMFNNAYSNWQGNAKLKYFLNDKINLVLSYSYNKYRVGLNGGVNVDSAAAIAATTSNTSLKDVVYGVSAIPVNDWNSYDKSTLHNLNLKFLSNLFPGEYTELSAYYRFNLDEYRQNEDTAESYVNVMRNDYRYKIFGGQLRQSYKYQSLNFDFIGNYQSLNYDINRTVIKNWENTLSLAGKMTTLFFGGKVQTSFFAKYIKYKDYNLKGIGADAIMKLTESSNLYLGYSSSEQNVIASVSDAYYGCFDGNYYKIKTANSVEFGFRSFTNDLTLNINAIYRLQNSKKDIFSAGYSVGYKYGKVLIENTSSYYNKKTDAYDVDYAVTPMYFLSSQNIEPAFRSVLGVYYQDILFDTNLDLKAGFKAKFLHLDNTANSYYTAGKYLDLFEKNIITVDFTAAGEVHKSAIIYFIWENLFDNKYFIIPFYPMPRRGIRFGVAWEFQN